MKIWIINHYAIPPSLGGLVRHYYFSKYLQERGHEVKIFTSSKIHNTDVNMITDRSLYIEKEVDGIEYTFVRTSNYKGNKLGRVINMLQFPIRIWRVCKKFDKPDVIYTSSPDLFTAFSAVLLARKMKLPKVVEVRDLWPESIVTYSNISERNPIMRILYKLERWIYKKADKIIFTMEGGKQYIEEKGWDKDVNIHKIEHINNGVDYDEFVENKEKWQLDDKDLQDESVFKVIYTGSIRRVNKIEFLLDCAKQLEQRHSNIIFLIWGDGTERKELEKRCLSEKITNVIFKGHVEKKFIPYILTRADVNLLHWEKTALVKYGCSLNKLFEYLAAGRMIISDVQVNYDLLEKKESGLVTEEQSVQEVCDMILKCVSMSQEEKEKYSERAKQCAREYDYKVLSEKLEQIFERARNQK